MQRLSGESSLDGWRRYRCRRNAPVVAEPSGYGRKSLSRASRLRQAGSDFAMTVFRPVRPGTWTAHLSPRAAALRNTQPSVLPPAESAGFHAKRHCPAFQVFGPFPQVCRCRPGRGDFPAARTVIQVGVGAGPSRGLGSAMTCRTPRIQPRCRTACTRSAGPTSGSHARTHPRRFAHGPDALVPQLFLFVCRSRCEVCWKVARDREAPHKGWSRPGSRPKWPILPLHAKGRGKGL